MTPKGGTGPTLHALCLCLAHSFHLAVLSWSERGSIEPLPSLKGAVVLSFFSMAGI